MSFPDYHTARKFPPRSATAYREATAAELIAQEHALDAERLYEVWRQEGHSLSDRFGEYMKHKKMAEALLTTVPKIGEKK